MSDDNWPSFQPPPAFNGLVVIRENGHMVMAVNERTRKTEDTPQQFYVSARTPDGFELQFAPRSEWVEHPTLIEIDSRYGFGVPTKD